MYTSGLAAAPAVSTSAAGRLTSGIASLAAAVRPNVSGPTAPLKIVPPEFERLEGPIRTIGASVPAGTVAVVAWPFVLLSDAQIRSALDAISGPSGVGPAVVSGVATVATASSAQDVQSRAASMAPSFLACGFIRDPEVDQSVTRGYLWIAASWSQTLPATTVSRAMGAIMAAALPAGSAISSRPTQPSAGQIGSLRTVPVAADSEADVALEDAAKKGVLAVAQAAVAIAGGLFGNITVSFGAARLRSQIHGYANNMAGAVNNIQAAPILIQQVDALSAQALALPPESQAAAGAALLQLKRRLAASKTAISTGAAEAPTLLQVCAIEMNAETSQVAKAIREQIVSDAQSKLAAYMKVPSVARKFAMASLWRRAQAQFDGALRGLSLEIESMCAAAQSIVNNGSSVAVLVAAIDAAISKIDYSYAQLQIPWWQRDLWGVPTYYWIGGGSVVVLGLVGWRVRVKRRRAESSVAKNRRAS